MKLLTFRDDVRAVVESTGNLWIQIHDILEKYGIEVSLSNPYKTRLIAEAKNKTDKVDAKMLARLLRADMLFTYYVPGEEIRNHREFLRHRMNLVKMRTQVKNRIHSILDKQGLRIPYSTKFSKKSITWLRKQDLDFMDEAIVDGQLALLENLDEQIRVLEDKIAAIAVEDPQVRLLMTMPGIGFFTASLLVAEIGDINRFGNDKKISSWATLAPRISQSGEKVRIGRVSGPGNKRVAAMMVQCAHTVCSFDARFKRFYERAQYAVSYLIDLNLPGHVDKSLRFKRVCSVSTIYQRSIPVFSVCYVIDSFHFDSRARFRFPEAPWRARGNINMIEAEMRRIVIRKALKAGARV
jgi:transposase